MRIVPHPTARRFLGRALPWLLRAEVENNLILGIALGCARREDSGPREGESGKDPPWFATVEDDRGLHGAAFRTPPHMLGFTPLPRAAVEPLTEAADAAFGVLPGVVGEPATADAVAGAWSRRHPVTPADPTDMGIHRLARLRWPHRPAPGHMRRAEAGDAPLLTRWMEGFESDTGIFSTGAASLVSTMVAEEALFIWEVDGRPASMAGLSGATPNAARISYVYIPPEDRGRGYAAMITASLARRILETGHRWAVLYTDLAAPLPNRIYRRLGFERVTDARMIRFE